VGNDPASNEDNDEYNTEEYFHVRLGSAKKLLLTFQDVEQNHARDKAFERFRIKLNQFLNNYFRSVRGSLPHGRPVQFSADDTVR